MKWVTPNLFKYRDLLVALTHNELMLRYGLSTGGFLWMIIHPLAYLMVLSIIFTYVVPISIRQYPLFLFSGLLPWMYFIGTLSSVTPSLAVHADLMRKSPFPRIIIPLSGFIAQTMQFFVALTIFLVAIFLFGVFQIESGMIWSHLWSIFFAIILECTFLFGMVLLTSKIYIFFRDIAFAINALALIWFYATPIIYPISFVPKNFLPFYSLNPMVGIIELYRFSFGIDKIYYPAIIFSILISLATLLVGYYVFIKNEKNITDYL